MTLGKTDDAVVGMEIVQERATLLVVCEHGYGKRTPFDDFRVQRRGGKGIIAIKTSKRNGLVVGALSVTDQDDVIVMTAEGKMMRTPASQIRTVSRNTVGVRIISLGEGDKVVDIAKSAAEASEQEAEQTARTENEPTDDETN